jgi:chemotaxis family two-component system response regulator PixH
MQRKTIVVADGDADVRSEIRRGLEAMGFSVVEAPNGEAALHALCTREVGLLVTDLYLRTGTDPCLLRSLRRDAALRRVKVLVVTVHHAMRDRDWALREGADAFLPRPAELARVLQLASRLANARGPARRASWRAG